jgi:hypothetical protein
LRRSAFTVRASPQGQIAEYRTGFDPGRVRDAGAGEARDDGESLAGGCDAAVMTSS